MIVRCRTAVVCQTVLVADHSSANSLPIRIRLTFDVTGSRSDVTMSSATLDLERNDRVKPTALVVLGGSDGSVKPFHLNYPNVSGSLFIRKEAYLRFKIIV